MVNSLNSLRVNRELDPVGPCAILKTALSFGGLNHEETCYNLNFNRISLFDRLIISWGKWDKRGSRNTS